MINICFFAGDITRSGGTERVAITVANGLSRIGKYKISFLSLVEQKKIPFYPISPEIKRFVLKKDRKWCAPGIGYVYFLPTLRQFLRKEDIDIVIDVDLVLDVLTFPASMRLDIRIISWEHFNLFFERSIGYRRVIVWFTVHFSDYIVTLTERDRQNYMSIAHRRKGIATIDNPINFLQKSVLVKEKIIITVGQLIYRKGIDLLAQIIPKILYKYKDWKSIFLGDGEYMEILKQVHQRYKLEERLVLAGEVKNVESYLAHSSIMVMGSREEGLGMCFLEARAFRVPCIAFDVPVGPLELIAHGVNGFLIPPFDLNDMIDKISLLIEDEFLREKFMDNTSLGMEKFSLDVVLKKWVDLLDKVHNK